MAAKLSPKRVLRNGSARERPPRPFLRWAGGKANLAEKLRRFVPPDVDERRYFEPFLGAGAVFFSLQHPKANLSDLNGHLIECYRAIRDAPTAVARELRAHAQQDCEPYYYLVRDRYNRSRGGIARAAKFLYLNRTGFNGVFRVNQQGSYNVPYGKKEAPFFPSEAELLRVAAALGNAHLETQDYSRALIDARAGDFVYLDPPYPPLNGTSFFTHYTKDRFGADDQVSLADTVRELNARGCLVMLSNADTAQIRQLYGDFEISSLSVTRYVTSSAVKHRVGELIITNYIPPRDH
jgi:DNA adenine methylase